MINIGKVEFLEIMEEEIIFMDKKFNETDGFDSEVIKKRFLARYYESLSYMTPTQLKAALRACRESFNYFPRIHQILKLGVSKQPLKSQELPNRPIMNKALERKIENVTNQKGYKIGSSLMEEMKRTISARWEDTDFTETFKQWDQQNEAKIEL